MKTSDKRLPPWGAQTSRLWSLLDVIEFLGNTFLSLRALIQDQYYVAKVLGEKGDEFSADERQYIGSLALSFLDECKALGFEASAFQAGLLAQQVMPNRVVPHAAIHGALEGLIAHTANEFRHQRFAFIPRDCHKYFEQENLFFLNRPDSQFPSAEQDIRDAGNAFAVGLYTATVFHAMRVAEIGLRVFARHLRVGLPRKKGPIEWAQWEDVLKGIQKKIDLLSIRAGTKPKKNANRAFYRGLLTEIEGFKDVYRNNVMHARGTYTRPEAQRALDGVGEFMRRLGSRLHE